MTSPFVLPRMREPRVARVDHRGSGLPPAREHDESRSSVNDSFADRATRLAGHMGLAFAWTPDTFWTATPAEIAALVRAVAGDAPAAFGTAELAQLMEAFPDG